jgi:hypothetical protein
LADLWIDSLIHSLKGLALPRDGARHSGEITLAG